MLFLIPLLLVSIWTEIASLLAEAGLRGVLFDLPGAYRSVNARGLLQLLLLAPVLYRRLVEKRRQEVAPEILRLADELSRK